MSRRSSPRSPWITRINQGQIGAQFTVTVTNSGTPSTNGVVALTDAVPTGLTPAAASGAGWTCGINGAAVTCTRSDALAPGASYPAVTITVNVAANAPASVANTATISGGGDVDTANNTATDVTTVLTTTTTTTTTTVGPFTTTTAAATTTTVTPTTSTTTPTPPQCTDASCNDGNICNGVETCRAGVCTAGSPLNCDDGDPCTIDSCAPASGCQHTTVADLGSCSTVIPGGENKKSDCYVFADLEGMHPIENQKTLVCSDGDPTCDMDGQCNNVCDLKVRLCINSATMSQCTPPSQLASLNFKSHPATFTLNKPAQLTGAQCGAVHDVLLPVKVSKKGKKSTGVLKVTATAKAPKPTKPKSDNDTYIMKCVPGCAPS